MAGRATWVILAGGKGTRSENPSIPKLLQRVGSTDILGLLLTSLPTDEELDAVFILKHGANHVETELTKRAVQYPNANFRVLHDEGAGPVAALKKVSQLNTESTLAVILGDTAIVAPLGDYLDRYMRLFPGKPAISIRQSDHLHDSNAVALDCRGQGVRHFGKGEELDFSAGTLWGMSGLMFLPSDLVAQLDAEQKDVAASILHCTPLNEAGFLPLTHFFRDSGTPERLNSIRNHLKENLAPLRMSARSKRPALFVDRDGTLIPDNPVGRRDVRAEELNLRVVNKIRRANESGVPVFLCTNQPAIAKGFVTFGETYTVHNQLQDLLRSQGARLDDFLVCPHHPESGHHGEEKALKVVCDCRKPHMGMLIRAQIMHGIALDGTSEFIGDSSVDLETATKAGVKFTPVDSL